MYIYVSVRMYTHTYMHIHIYIYVCACTYVHMYICAYTYIYIYTCVHVFICSAPFQIHRARSNAVRLFCRHIPEEDRVCTTASVLASRSRTSPSTRPIASRPDFACTLGERLVMRPLFGSTLCCTHNCDQPQILFTDLLATPQVEILRPFSFGSERRFVLLCFLPAALQVS